MKKLLYLFIFTVIVILPACSFNFPVDWDSDYSYGDYSIVLQITPDDAHVLLNGKFIGEAYEFSTRASALRLRSKRDELVIKKIGYLEELIELDKYNMRKITVRITMKPDSIQKHDTGTPGKTPPPPPPPKEEKEYKGVKEKDIPKIKPKSQSTPVFSRVIMEVSPSEASIYVDGKFWGISPDNGVINNFNLKKGKHRIEVVKPGYKTVLKTVNITSQKELKIKVILEKK